MYVRTAAAHIVQCAGRVSATAALRAGVSALALQIGALMPAEARSLLDRSPNAAAAAAATAQVSGQAAAAAASQAMNRVGASLKALRDQQAAARAAAMAASSAVPNGLVVNGLVPDSGLARDGLANPVKTWVGARTPTQTQAGGRTQIEIKQDQPKAILTWSKFNVGRATDLYFNQTAGDSEVANWIALNRVLDPTGAPSQILGAIKAEGQVYVINKNGIIFGGASQVNVHTLVASSLSLSNEQFNAGINTTFILSNIMHLPQFGDANPRPSDPFVTVSDPAQVPRYTPNGVPGDVRVEAGAQIKTASGGKAMLFAPHVTNAGRIEVPDGQVILAAGEQVWLAPDPNGVRGFDVAVSAPMPWHFNYDHLRGVLFGAPQWAHQAFADSVKATVVPEMLARAASVGYQVVNAGEVSADRGNITLQGREVVQAGALLATTALNNRSGSIRLRAYSLGMLASNGSFDSMIANWNAGDLHLAPGSVTAVTPDPTDKSELETSALKERYAAGRIELRGRLIDIQSAASVVVPAGVISAVASTYLIGADTNPSLGPLETSAGANKTDRDGSRLYIGSDAFLSVAGLQNVLVSMDRNFVEAEVRINELRDSVLYRDSWLRGKKITVDRRVSGKFADGPMADVNWVEGSPGKWIGTPLADVTAWVNVGKTDLLELSSVGGSINLKSGGALVTRAGSLIDVSGGSIRYSDGISQTTRLIGADGRLYPISQATPDRIYTGIARGFSREHKHWEGPETGPLTETWSNPFGRSRVEKGYTEGKDAGTLQMLAGEAIVLEGALAGGVIIGERQAASGSVAVAGKLRIGGPSDDDRPWSLGQLTVTTDPVKLPESFTVTSAIGPEFFLPAPDVYFRGKTTYITSDFFRDSGFGTFDLYATRGFTLPAGQPLELAPGTAFGISSYLTSNLVSDFVIDSTIRTPGGKITLGGPTVKMSFGAGAGLDASGQWANDLIAASSGLPPKIHGGEIRIDVASLTTAGSTVLDVSGGGWIRRASGAKPKLDYGNGGSIQLPGLTAADIARLNMRAYSAAVGGRLTYSTAAPVQLGGPAPSSASVLQLPGTLYGERGFRYVKITASQIVVPDGAAVSLQPVGIDVPLADLYDLPTGASLAQAGQIGMLPLETRAKAQPELSLNAGTGGITIGTDASIRTDHGGIITLATSGLTSNIAIRGKVEAPAGAISVTSGGTLLLANGASLLARGAPVIATDTRGLRSGTVAPGGTITISGSGLITLEQRALIDVAGATGEIDVAAEGRETRPVQLASNGGSIAITLRSFGSTVDAMLVGQAGGEGALGGSLTITDQVSSGGPARSSSLPATIFYWLHPTTGVVQRATLPTAGLELDIKDEYPGSVLLKSAMRSAINALPAYISVGMVVSKAAGSGSGSTLMLKPWEVDPTIDPRVVDLINKYFWQGTGTGAGAKLGAKLNIIDVPVAPTTRVAADSIGNGGFGSVALNASSGMKLDSGVDLIVGGTLAISGPSLGNLTNGSASITASQLTVGGGTIGLANTATTAGSLRLSANVINVGTATIRGFADTILQATDIRLSSGFIGGSTVAPAVLDVQGRLILKAGQVYPTTVATVTIKASEKIVVEPNGTTAAPFSAGGMLTLDAPVIEQRGVLRAPFGEITLKASTSLTLAAGSVTSVSGDGLILPYGTLVNNEFWQDPRTNNTLSLAAPPEKRIVLDAPTVNLAAGSLVDIHGGGDLYTSEFVPGPGGSRNILARPGTYAILPGYSSAIAPTGTGFAAGERIWLAGGNGLAAGWYTLLPAGYALLPGAYAVTPVAGSAGKAVGPTVRLLDGSSIMAGGRGNALNRSHDQLASSWRVMSGPVVRSYTEFNEAFATGYFASDAFKLTQYRLTGNVIVTPRLPSDGGSLVLKATQQLLLDGQLQAQAVAGGRGGLVDIAGTKIAVLGAGQSPTALRADGYLVIDAGNLTRFGAESLLIGGTRTGDSKGVRLNVNATGVVVRNDAASELAGPEIILAASGMIDIGAGSVITARGEVSGASLDLIVTPQQAARDYGVLVRLANGDAVKVVRQNVDIATGGVVTVGAGAKLSGGRALLIDATRNTVLASTAELSGRALSVASGRIGFGGGTQGLVLSAASLAQLSQTQRLTLRSYSTIDFHDSIDFGGDGLKAVTLDAAGLVGYGTRAVAATGDTIVLDNNGGTFVEPTGAGTGTLSLAARELVLGTGTKALRGFSTVTLAGSERIVGAGTGAINAGSSAVTLRTPVLTGRAGSAQSLTTTGALTVAGQGGGSPKDIEQSIGARLALTASSVTFGGTILARGGAVEITATAGALVLDDGSRIDVGGFGKQFFDVTEYASAGRVSLTAVGGDVDLRMAAVIDLSAAPGGGDGGKLSLTAANGSTVRLDGTIRAQAGEGGAGGSFSLDIATLPSFAGLAAKLSESGFSGARQFRIRDGNVVIDGTTMVSDFSLAADRGSVTVTGVIDAYAPYGGRIAISAGNGLTMLAGAALTARATSFDGLGSGRVTLEASGGALDLRGGTIDVSGGEGGRVRLRARQTAGHDEIAVSALQAQIVGARSAVLEGVSVYDNQTSVDAIKSTAIADALAFAGHGAAIKARLGLTTVAVMPGIEIRSAGDLTLGSDWNLFADFAGARAGGLTLRAAGNLIINGHLSDGFNLAGRTGVLQAADSWDLRLVAGADLTSASATALTPLAGLAPGSGSLTVGTAGAGKQVRTGTGDLEVRVGRQLDLADWESVIYTAGRKDTTSWSDFTSLPVIMTSDSNGGTFIAAPTPNYGILGGHLSITAQGDIKSTLPADETRGQLFAEWLNRMGKLSVDGCFCVYQDGGGPNQAIHQMQQSSWWVNYGEFKQGVGALGGGNVSVSAGGDLVNLLVALPTNGRVRGGRTVEERKLLELRNGGAMTVDAGGAIRAGRYYIGRGDGAITAGEMVYGRNVTVSGTVYPVAPILALGDATLTVRTAGAMQVQTVTDPLLHEIALASVPLRLPLYYGAKMSGYTDRTALTLESIGGDVLLVGQTAVIARSVTGANSWDTSFVPIGSGANRYPAKTHIAALGGSITNGGALYTMPSVSGELFMAAERDIVPGTIYMARALPQALPSPFSPTGTWFGGNLVLDGQLMTTLVSAPRLLLADDYQPSRIYARNGSILGGTFTANESLWLQAGTDIRNVTANLRNLHRTDVSLLQAGNDLINATLDVEGPGGVTLAAGRDVYGALSIITRGNRLFDGSLRPVAGSDIKGLPREGASVAILAGVGKSGPAYDAFVAAYLDPANVAKMPDYLKTNVGGQILPIYLTDRSEIRSDGEVKIVRHGIVSFVAQITGDTLAPLDAWARFQSMPRLTQERFIRQAYLEEVRQAGRDQKEPGVNGLPLNGGYNRAYTAIATLFPGNGWKGDVTLSNGLVRTQSGGAIDVLTPGGGLQVAGLTATVPAGFGLVTLGFGDIRLFAHDDIVLNQSRVLTFAGGDELLWSTRGGIDAGRGAKTIRLNAAPDIITDNDGVTRILERPNITGAGFGTVADYAGVPKGDVDPYAPEGTINFGDAGVRVSGNLTIGALFILNADNLKVSGEVKGLTKAGASSDIKVDSNSQDKSADAAVKAATATGQQERPSVIIVEVLGYGGGEGERPRDGEQPRKKPDEESRYDPTSPLQYVGIGALTAAQMQKLTLDEQRRLEKE